MKTLFILNDPPYGTERSYDALRLALALLKNDPAAHVSLFLMPMLSLPRAAGRRHRTAITTSSAC
jgi:uncharacterized protein involved in oxidation of intracellular sulfur